MLTFASTLNDALATLVQGLTESDVPGTSTSCNDYVDEGSDADAEESEFEEDEETDTEAEPVGKKNEEQRHPSDLLPHASIFSTTLSPRLLHDNHRLKGGGNLKLLHLKTDKDAREILEQKNGRAR